MVAPADDLKFMAAALELSRSHTGLTGTNPSVGCVLVKDGVVVGAAVTAVGGRPHAEAGALAIAGDAARGATAYVTLEPCAHHGKTPPCANALVAAGVSRVVISVIDPDERVAGKGVQILSEAGIEVETGIMVAEGKRALAGYLTRKIKKRPHVILKLAISADGMIGKKDVGQVAITGPQSREAVHHLRAECDAILVGIGTALADDPELTVRIPGLEQRSPIRIVLDRKLELPLSSKLVKTARDVPVIAVTNDPLSARRGALEAAGVEVLVEDDLQGLLASLGARGLSSLLVEGGAAIARSFLDAGLVDRILLFEAPVVIGEGGVETPLERSDISGQYSFVGEQSYGPDRCFDYERGL